MTHEQINEALAHDIFDRVDRDIELANKLESEGKCTAYFFDVVKSERLFCVRGRGHADAHAIR